MIDAIPLRVLEILTCAAVFAIAAGVLYLWRRQLAGCFPDTCPDCHGSGLAPHVDTHGPGMTCTTCDGLGHTDDRQMSPRWRREHTEDHR